MSALPTPQPARGPSTAGAPDPGRPAPPGTAAPLVMLEPHRARPGPATAPRLHAETCYRGVPVYSAAVLVQAKGREATFHVNRCLANALMRTGSATLFADTWDSPLHGHVSRVDLERLHVTLDGLTRGVLPISRRSDPRIAVDETIAVRLSVGEREVTGRLIDVSVRAIAAFYGNVDLGDLAPGQAVRIDMILPRADPAQCVEFDTGGRLMRVDRVTGTEQVAWRVVVGVECDDALLQRLTRYIAEHQQAVLAELANARAPRDAPRAAG